MAANNLGTAYIKIAPQMEGLQSAISKGLQGAVKSSVASTTAIGTIVAKGMNAAMNAVTSSLDRAISRVDTLNAFPKIMKNMGFTAQESEDAINKLAARIEGLPTALDEIVVYTQRFASTTGNLNKGLYNATNLAIAFNDAALAGGKGQEAANRAFEQFAQVISRGRPTMQDWKIMMEVMPGQLRQMAQYMGQNNKSLQEYAKNAQKTVDELDGMDLYNWISADKNEHARERLQQLTESLIDLDNKGGGGIKSFKDQVGDATKTIGNAIRLIPLRISKAIAEIIKSFGAEDIYNAIDAFTSSFKNVGNFVAKNIVPVIKNALIPAIKGAFEAIKGFTQFILSNQYVVDVLKNLFTTLVAFKALSFLKTGVLNLVGAGTALVKNVSEGISVFKAAHGAGLSLGSSIGAVAGQVGGLSGSITSAISTALNPATIILGGLTVAVLGLQAAAIGSTRDMNIASRQARDYARSHYDLAKAAESAKKALDLQKLAVEDLKTAELAATNDEIAAIEAKKNVQFYQQEMNRLLKEGKQNTDEYRLAELNYNKALAEQKIANDKLAESQKVVAEEKQKLDDINSSEIYKANLAIGTIMRENKEYGSLAAQLDALKNQTITYKDEHGNMVEATKAKTEEMVKGWAEQLAYGRGETATAWRQIVDIANKEGISYAEACAKFGKEGGKDFTGNFSVGIKQGQPLMETSAEGAAEAIKGKLREASDNATSIGFDVSSGLATGITNGKRKISAAVSQVSSWINNMFKSSLKINSPSKLTQEFGMWLDLGLAKGLKDYAYAAEDAAAMAAERTASAFGGSFGMNGNMSQVQPQSGLTSGMNGSNGQVVQYNTFNVDSELDVKDVSKRLGWQVATAL